MTYFSSKWFTSLWGPAERLEALKPPGLVLICPVYNNTHPGLVLKFWSQATLIMRIWLCKKLSGWYVGESKRKNFCNQIIFRIIAKFFVNQNFFRLVLNICWVFTLIDMKITKSFWLIQSKNSFSFFRLQKNDGIPILLAILAVALGSLTYYIDKLDKYTPHLFFCSVNFKLSLRFIVRKRPITK